MWMKCGDIIEAMHKKNRVVSGVGRFVVVFYVLLATFPSTAAGAASDSEGVSTEYQMKVAFLYNFMKFVDWPDPNSVSNSDTQQKLKEPVILGVMGDNYFGNNLNDLAGKTIKGRPLKMVIIEGYDTYKQAKDDATLMDYLAEHQKVIQSCHLLFISASEKDRFAEILKYTEKQPILTVSDIHCFVEAGGVIGFVMENNRIRFDINTVSAEIKRMKISSQLLQLARKIFKKQADKQKL